MSSFTAAGFSLLLLFFFKIVTGLFHKVSLPLLEPPVPNPQLQMSSNKSNASGSTKKSKAKSFKRLQPIPIAPYQSVHKPPL
ncbi:hypothetical protein EON65_05435 [archaeon]|nr:MAG: hypothetical protein EON65_05435 [archaeon]